MPDHSPYAEPVDPHKGWHSRGYPPHFDQPGLVQSLTFRLADSLPARVRERLGGENDEVQFSRQVERALDNGYGACHLRNPRVAEMVENALLHFDEERYRMLAWVIMPNHVHCVFEMREGFPLSGLLHSWRSFTAHEAAKIVSFDPPFWWDDYFDRYVRDYDHYQNVVFYIHRNPVSAGLCDQPEDWRWSSAHRKRPTLSKIVMPDGSFRDAGSAGVSPAPVDKLPQAVKAGETPALPVTKTSRRARRPYSL